MSELSKIADIETPFRSHPHTNVEGWERIGSLAGGVLMMGKGLRRGGLFGLIQLGIGGLVLARGITGHSKAKALLEAGRDELGEVRANIQQAGNNLLALKDVAKAATVGATVTGNDSLEDPKPL